MCDIRHMTFSIPYAWEHPFTALKNVLATHGSFIEHTIETVLAAAFIIIITVEDCFARLHAFVCRFTRLSFFSANSPGDLYDTLKGAGV